MKANRMEGVTVLRSEGGLFDDSLALALHDLALCSERLKA